MTLKDCITRLRTRLEVDLETEIDLTDNNEATKHIQIAARQVSRNSCAFYTANAVLTLAANDQQIDLLSSKCSVRIHRVEGVYINQGWLTRCRHSEFFDTFTDYLTATPTPSPTYFTAIKDDVILLDRPINSVGAAATNYARGFMEHRDLTYSVDQNLEMDGPDTYHLLYVNQAVLNLSLGTVSGSEAMQRRAMIQQELDDKVMRAKIANLSAFKSLRKRAMAGNVRRIGTITNYGY